MSIFLRLGCILAPRFPLLSARFGSGRCLVDSKQYLAIGLCRSQMPLYCAVILACIAQWNFEILQSLPKPITLNFCSFLVAKCLRVGFRRHADILAYSLLNYDELSYPTSKAACDAFVPPFCKIYLVSYNLMCFWKSIGLSAVLQEFLRVVEILLAAKFHHFTAAQAQARAGLIDRRVKSGAFFDGRS